MAGKVLFWDIDGTLLTTGRAGIFAWEDAVRAVLNVRECDLSTMHTAGMTDVQIARQLVLMHGGEPGDEVVRAVVRVYENALPERLPLRQGSVLPGVRAVLDEVGQRPEIASLLLTGNTRAGARAKLTHYDLVRYFTDGGFADDAPDRPGVAARALMRAQALLGERCPPPEEMYVIGDTPDDIACGKAIGARTIAVATGVYSVSQLNEHEPWLTLEALPEPALFLQALNGTGA